MLRWPFLQCAAVIMAVRGSDATRIEGVVWIALSVFLFWQEMHFIRIERDEQNQSFAKLIGDGENLLALTARNLENITGGDGYCWLVPERPGARWTWRRSGPPRKRLVAACFEKFWRSYVAHL